MKIAVIVSVFPNLSETFILGQIATLVGEGHDLQIFAEQPHPSPTILHADYLRLNLRRYTRYWYKGSQSPPFPRPLDVKRPSIYYTLRAFRRRVLDGATSLRSLKLPREWLPVHSIQGKFDVIHCHFGPNGQRATILREMGKLKGPIVTTFHGYDANLLPRVHGTDLYRHLFANGEAFTVGSDFMRKRIVSLGAPPNKIERLPMGIDINHIRPLAVTSAPSGRFSVLTVARLVEVKGIEYALRAIAFCRDTLPNITYRIVGDGPLRGHLELLTHSLGIAKMVEFAGAASSEDIVRHYHNADVFVLPSIVTDSGEEENQPTVLAEAQAAGLPVIATTIGGVAESMRENETGFLVPPRDSQALCNALIWMERNRSAIRNMGLKGRSFIEENFSLSSLNKDLIALYQRIGVSRPAIRNGLN